MNCTASALNPSVYRRLVLVLMRSSDCIILIFGGVSVQSGPAQLAYCKINLQIQVLLMRLPQYYPVGFLLWFLASAAAPPSPACLVRNTVARLLGWSPVPPNRFRRRPYDNTQPLHARLLESPDHHTQATAPPPAILI